MAQFQSSNQAQDLLFEGDFSPLPEDLGFRGPVACGAADITYRQLDYWARTGLVVPEIRAAGGSGTAFGAGSPIAGRKGRSGTSGSRNWTLT